MDVGGGGDDAVRKSQSCRSRMERSRTWNVTYFTIELKVHNPLHWASRACE